MATETSAKIIDGKAVAKQIRDEISSEISRMKDAVGAVPGLAVILVGDRKDSATYVRNKKKAFEAVGILSYEAHFPEDCAKEDVLKCISDYNNDNSIHGILVQLPLPRHMNEEKILNAVNIEKDVDDFHPLNIGRLAMRGREPLFVPCTPKGCIELLHRYDISIKGKRDVVIGRSNIVGIPAALLLQVRPFSLFFVFLQKRSIFVRTSDPPISIPVSISSLLKLFSQHFGVYVDFRFKEKHI
ncbi:Bifunctional protein FolD 4 [Ranunculus cassubicifolius]